MTLLERLHELNATRGRAGNEDLAHWADRNKDENLWVRDIALPALLEVADIGDELATAVREWSLELNNTTISDCVVLAIRYQQTLAKLEEGGRADA